MKPQFKCKLTTLFGIVFVIILLIFFSLSFSSRKAQNVHPKIRHQIKLVQTPKPVISHRIVHIDLKGAPLKVEYYSKLFPLLKKLGATGVLMEYEDMFPYSGKLSQIPALNAYSHNDIETIKNLARESDLKLIPFIQLFGHLDFVLKLEEYVDYREVYSLPSTICPSYNKTVKLLQSMIEQIIAAHSETGMIHIGCDMVPYLGHCSRCSHRIINENLTNNDLYLDHVLSVVKFIKSKYPSVEILLWDDHFRTIDPEEVSNHNLQFKPVVWWYGKDVYDEFGPSLWKMYSELFPKLWVASAFKGAIGNNKYISDVNHYIQNHKSWISVIEEYKNTVEFEGIIITGWQRYDHFAVLCELIPAGIPALAMSLRLLQGHKDSALSPPLEVARMLQCDRPYGLIGSAFESPKCQFPGGAVLENLIYFHQLEQEFQEILDDARMKGWLSEFNKKTAFSNPKQVKPLLIPLDKVKRELIDVKISLRDAMLDIYDEYTVNEWYTTYFQPLERQIVSLWKATKQILGKTFWPRRPFVLKSDL